jgi:hypothetical protein
MEREKRILRGKGLNTLITAVAMALLAFGSSAAFADEPIVGYWQATFKDTNSKDVVSYVWDVWHSDRTETQNDSSNTISGNVCQGAWVPLGQRTYGLTHPSFAFAVEGAFPFPTETQEGQFIDSYSCNILERVTVDKSGDNYSGPGLIKCVAGIDPLDPTAHVNFTENISITAKRVKVDVNQLPPA